MSWGMQYPVQILSAVCMPRCCTCLIPAQTMPRLSCRWICPIYLLNITSDSTGFPQRRTRIVFFFFHLCICFPSIPAHINIGDQCGWQTWWLHACVERARRITGVFARPCTTCGEGGKWHDWPNGDPPLRALGKRGGSLCSLFDTKGCRGRRVDVCEIHHTAASLAQWSVKLSPSSARTPSYTFLSPLLRAVHAGLLSTALSQRSTPVITMTGSATPWQAAQPFHPVGDGQDRYAASPG